MHPEGKATDRKTLTVPGQRTHPRGHTAEVYQEKRYWQSAVSWLNSGIPSFTKGSQWKKMVEDTDFVLSFPHLEDEANTTSRSPSVGKENTVRPHDITIISIKGRVHLSTVCKKFA